MLKNVVLPAPFGPMSDTIEPRGMSKSTLLTASRPPNRLVTRGPGRGSRRPGRRRSAPTWHVVPARSSWRLLVLVTSSGSPRRPARSAPARPTSHVCSVIDLDASSSSAVGRSPGAQDVCSSAARWRLGRKPSGRNRIITTSRMPKIRKLNCGRVREAPVRDTPGSAGRARAGASCRCRRARWRPTSTPQMFPMPPRMTMISTRIEVENWKKSDVVAPR